MGSASLPSLAAIVVPAYLGFVHEWLYVQRRREPVHLWLGLLAAGLAAAAAVAGTGDSPLHRASESVALAIAALAGAAATRSFLATRRNTGENVAWAVALAALGTLALARLVLPVVAAPGPDAALVFVGLGAPALVTLSGVLVQRFVGKMAEAEGLATHRHDLVDERSRELREKELQLAHGEQLASLGALAAGVARTMQEPLHLVGTNLGELGTLWQRPEHAARVPRLLAECRAGLDRLRVVVSEVLAIARRSDGSVEPVELGEVVRSVLPMLRPLAGERVELREDLAPLPPVLGDRRLLGQVALQLLLNAIQARPGARVERNVVSVTTRFEDGVVRLRVEDSGPAIPPEVLPRVFDPFFAPEEGERGPELGLAVTHQIVARHRGQVRVESDESGTRVTVDLPVAREGGGAGGPDDPNGTLQAL